MQRIKCEIVLAPGGLPILDLEKAVKTNAMDHHLKNENNQSDGPLSFERAYDDASHGIVLPIVDFAVSSHPKE